MGHGARFHEDKPSTSPYNILGMYSMGMSQSKRQENTVIYRDLNPWVLGVFNPPLGSVQYRMLTTNNSYVMLHLHLHDVFVHKCEQFS